MRAARPSICQVDSQRARWSGTHCTASVGISQFCVLNILFTADEAPRRALWKTVVHHKLQSEGNFARPRAKGNPYRRKLFVRRVIEESCFVTEASEAAGWSERRGFNWLGRWRDATWRFCPIRKGVTAVAFRDVQRRRTRLCLSSERIGETAWK